MRYEKLTSNLQQALAEAQSLAVQQDQQYLEPLHLLLALLRQRDGNVQALLQRCGVVLKSLENTVDEAVKRLPQVSKTQGDVQISPELLNVHATCCFHIRVVKLCVEHDDSISQNKARIAILDNPRRVMRTIVLRK